MGPMVNSGPTGTKFKPDIAAFIQVIFAIFFVNANIYNEVRNGIKSYYREWHLDESYGKI